MEVKRPVRGGGVVIKLEGPWMWRDYDLNVTREERRSRN